MIPLCIPHVEGNEWKYIKECLDTNWVSSVGSYVNLFESKFKEYVRSESAVVTMNGTAAIMLALHTLGIGNGDEVIVPSMTFVASVTPVKNVGATPVFVDVTDDTWVMDVQKVEDCITDKTKAIIPVHLYGNMVDMEPLLEIARKHNLYIIEDATEALGSAYKMNDGKWHKAGTLGDFGTYSFNGNKLITTGAGGMLVTNDVDLGKKAKYLSNQAKTVVSNGGFYHEHVGYNYRMPNVLAAMGVAQLEKIEEFVAKKVEHAEMYKNYLGHVKGIQLPMENDNVKHVHWLYSILVNKEFGLSRDEVIEKLKSNKIMSRPFFLPIHSMKPYKNDIIFDMSTTEKISMQGICLPSSVSLTKYDIERICGLIVG